MSASCPNTIYRYGIPQYAYQRSQRAEYCRRAGQTDPYHIDASEINIPGTLVIGMVYICCMFREI